MTDESAAFGSVLGWTHDARDFSPISLMLPWASKLSQGDIIMQSR